MKPIDIKEIELFKEEINHWKNKKQILMFLKEGYEIKGQYFHKFFLHSACSMGIDIAVLTELLQFIKSIKKAEFRLIEKDIEYIIHLKERIQVYENEIKQIFQISSQKIHIEDIFNYLEYIKMNMNENNLSLDNNKFPMDILDSQFSHILSSFSTLIEVITKLNVPSRDKEPSLINNNCRYIYESVAFKHSLKQMFLSLSVEHTKPIIEDNYETNGINYGKVYYSEDNLPYWSVFEKYRDLNFQSQSDNIISISESEDIMLKTKAMKEPLTNGVLRFDFAKAAENYAYKEVYTAYKLLIPIYGMKNTEFTLVKDNKKFQIEQMIEVYSCIYKLSLEMRDQNYQNGFIKVLGEKKLMRILDLDKSKVDLIRLFSFDLDLMKGHPYLVSFKPLIKKGNIYYILPNWISNISIEKAFDKILSDDSLVKINLINQRSKGELFEDSIESLFNVLNIPFVNLKQNARKGIHETDGMFMIGDYVFLFEAKATIKPENFVEAYNNLQGHLFKAYNQLIERIRSLESEVIREIIKKKSGIDLTGKKIVPFILLSHHYFNGYQELSLKLNEENSHIPIIDFLTLKNILESKSLPIWFYDEKKKSYLREEEDINTSTLGEKLNKYLLNQFKGLIVGEQPEFQLTQDNVMFRIVKSPRIHDKKLNKTKNNKQINCFF
ncbi:hypothetical protein CN692_07540 [Bacillus sp. AFS002410]|uniref:hypothetical protein n=1 Tax=Bacillus sp. AFS002410 TaxID=2033481 RepID=UPI000BF23D3B|nr:hypothetical protein [Bacillus sp. AFS002410]PEJ58820.1 hypothetical protein CN692_07540 [Bacillus sp. AFS002410]